MGGLVKYADESKFVSSLPVLNNRKDFHRLFR